MLLVFSVGCSQTAPGGETESRVSLVRAYAIPEGVDVYDRAEVYASGKRLPVYAVKTNVSQSWTPNDYQRTTAGVVLFELRGKTKITVKPDVQIDYTSRLRPLSAYVAPVADIENNTLTFTISSAGEYALEINGDTDNVIHFFVSDYDEQPPAREYADTVVFEAGLHTAANDRRIASDNTVRLNSDTRVVLEDGAVVRARFIADNKSNIEICGRGIIDGSAFPRDASRGTVTVPLEFNYCRSISLRQFSVLDPAGWCVNFYFAENSQIDDIKMISSRSNGDGISLQSCKNVSVNGCFVRTWDDSIVVKNYPRWSDRSRQGATENISVTDCTVWTDLAQSLEIGYETVGQKMEGITFSNIFILHALHLAPLSIHNANNADIKGVSFTDITVEDAKAPSGSIGIIDFRILFSDTWSTQHATTGLGSIDGVTVSNLRVLKGKPAVTVGGCRDVRTGYEKDCYVNNITLTDIEVEGTRPTKEDFTVRSTGYLRGFSVEQSGQVTGASFPFSATEEQLAEFGGECRVEIVG